MRHHLVSYLRLLGFSLSALALAACARLAPLPIVSIAPEPRLAPPPQGEMAAAPETLSEEELTAQTLASAEAAELEIVHLRKALDILGPLPDHPGMFIPVEFSDLDKPAAQSRRYSPVTPSEAMPPEFNRCGLGRFSGLDTGAGWNRLPDGVLEAYDTQGHNVRVAAPDDGVNALCVELSALAGPARVAAPIRASW